MGFLVFRVAQRCAQFVTLHNGYTVILHSKS